MLPGAHYSDPEFSWKFAVAPAGIGFVKGDSLGPQYANDLFVGASRPTLDAGYLFRFNLTGNRRKIGVDDPRLEDRVADNLAKFDPTESETIRFGTGLVSAPTFRRVRRERCTSCTEQQRGVRDLPQPLASSGWQPSRSVSTGLPDLTSGHWPLADRSR